MDLQRKYKMCISDHKIASPDKVSYLCGENTHKTVYKVRYWSISITAIWRRKRFVQHNYILQESNKMSALYAEHFWKLAKKSFL